MTAYANKFLFSFFRYLSIFSFFLISVCCVLVLLNIFDGHFNKNSFYRITISALCFSLIFITASFNKKLGILLCIFLLPLLPNITMQIQAFTGYGRIMHQHSPGLDVIAGLFLGSLINQFFSCIKYRSNQLNGSKVFDLPWIASLLYLFIFFSVVLAISRNLHQSQSSLNLNALMYNLIHFRTLGWHNDYRPIFDFVAYSLAFGFMAIAIPVIRNSNDKNGLIFKPLFLGLLISAIVAIIQSQTGRGLHAWQSFFRNDSLGFIALGFQPDIHSFAGHMMLGAVGLLGYLYYTKEISVRIIGLLLVIPFAWIGLILSKSKSNIALTLIFLLIAVLLIVLKRVGFTKKTLWLIAGFTALFVSSLWLTFPIWSNLFSSLPTKLNFDFQSVNLFMSYRPEIYAAAIRMFLAFPLLGLGQGDFYRLSSNLEFSQSSFLSIVQNGENAHNYFLQILAENGLIGMTLFALLIIYPIYKAQDKKTTLPAICAILSIFLSNLLAHSLLIRENLFVTASLIALLYGQRQINKIAISEHREFGRVSLGYAKSKTLTILFFFVLVILMSREIYLSFKSFPLTTDTQCFIARPLYSDGWTGGIYQEKLPVGSKGIELDIQTMPPDIRKKPLTVVFEIVHEKIGLLASQSYFLSDEGGAVFNIKLPSDMIVDDEKYSAKLKVDRCFIPMNMGINADERRLGVRVDHKTFLQ